VTLRLAHRVQLDTTSSNVGTSCLIATSESIPRTKMCRHKPEVVVLVDAVAAAGVASTEVSMDSTPAAGVSAYRGTSQTLLDCDPGDSSS
jgi:hypothetical protein